ncbi:MAG: hypothetical protein ABII25_01635, partial [bacterium]
MKEINNSTSPAKYPIGTPVIFQSNKKSLLERTGQHATVTGYGETMTDSGLVHYIEFGDGCITPVEFGEITPRRVTIEEKEVEKYLTYLKKKLNLPDRISPSEE